MRKMVAAMAAASPQSLAGLNDDQVGRGARAGGTGEETAVVGRPLGPCQREAGKYRDLRGRISQTDTTHVGPPTAIATQVKYLLMPLTLKVVRDSLEAASAAVGMPDPPAAAVAQWTNCGVMAVSDANGPAWQA